MFIPKSLLLTTLVAVGVGLVAATEIKAEYIPRDTPPSSCTLKAGTSNFVTITLCPGGSVCPITVPCPDGPGGPCSRYDYQFAWHGVNPLSQSSRYQRTLEFALLVLLVSLLHLVWKSLSSTVWENMILASVGLSSPRMLPLLMHQSQQIYRNQLPEQQVASLKRIWTSVRFRRRARQLLIRMQLSRSR